ncbi:hypothetical protein GGR55DRAFT_298015 [Xylaria sp. FL0064]|nr:hypothetical protein GGR55DRAFT_298015 [Xylaria sp. FL0064]
MPRNPTTKKAITAVDKNPRCPPVAVVRLRAHVPPKLCPMLPSVLAKLGSDFLIAQCLAKQAGVTVLKLGWHGGTSCTRQIPEHVVIEVETVSETDELQGVCACSSGSIRPWTAAQHTLGPFECSPAVGLGLGLCSVPSRNTQYRNRTTPPRRAGTARAGRKRAWMSPHRLHMSSMRRQPWQHLEREKDAEARLPNGKPPRARPRCNILSGIGRRIALRLGVACSRRTIRQCVSPDAASVGVGVAMADLRHGQDIQTDSLTAGAGGCCMALASCRRANHYRPTNLVQIL